MGTMRKIKKAANAVYRKAREHRINRKRIAIANRMMVECGENIPDLTQKQIEEIQAYWKQYGFSVTPEWHKLFYGITGKCDVRFVPDRIFHIFIKGIVNDVSFAPVWSDKAYLDRVIDTVATPRNVVRNVDGHFLDEEFKLISADEASRIIDQYDLLVIKPTIFTDTGKGVQLLKRPYDLASLDEKYCSNYIFQLPLKQHSEMALLNASSVNTIRFNSVLLDDGAHVFSAFVKVGQTGEFADNSGHNRFFIGISPEGKYREYAIDHQLHKYNVIPSGYPFAGKEVPFYREACKAIERAHACIPHFGFAFWDVCIDENGVPTIVEMNLTYPNSKIPQAACGPFMGDYTDRIIQYIMKNKKKFVHAKEKR